MGFFFVSASLLSTKGTQAGTQACTLAAPRHASRQVPRQASRQVHTVISRLGIQVTVRGCGTNLFGSQETQILVCLINVTVKTVFKDDICMFLVFRQHERSCFTWLNCLEDPKLIGKNRNPYVHVINHGLGVLYQNKEST